MSAILFEVGIRTLVCVGGILGPRVSQTFVDPCHLDLWPHFKKRYVQSISPTLFKFDVWLYLRVVEPRMTFLSNYDLDFYLI